jgi:hypothetical protein
MTESLINRESKGRQRNVDTAAGERQFDRSGWIAKLPSTNLGTLKVLVTPAISELESSVELRQRRLLGDQESASDRLRHAARLGR